MYFLMNFMWFVVEAATATVPRMISLGCFFEAQQRDDLFEIHKGR